MNQEAARPGERKSGRAGQGAIFLCAVFWSTSGLFIKLVDLHPVVIVGARSFLAALFLLALRLPGRAARTGISPAGLFSFFGREDFFFVAAGGLSYAATMITFVIANKHTASANAILLQYTAPLWAALLGWVIAGEKPRLEHWAALVLACFGMPLFFRDGLGGGNFFGDVLAIVSGIAFGAHSVFLRMIKKGSPADAVFLSHGVCVLFSIPFFFLHPPAFTALSLGAVLFMGIVQIGAASALFAWGIRRVTAVEAMLTATIEPVLNPVWVLLVTGEKPSLSVLAGGAVIIAAVLMSSIVSALRRRS